MLKQIDFPNLWKHELSINLSDTTAIRMKRGEKRNVGFFFLPSQSLSSSEWMRKHTTFRIHKNTCSQSLPPFEWMRKQTALRIHLNRSHHSNLSFPFFEQSLSESGSYEGRNELEIPANQPTAQTAISQQHQQQLRIRSCIAFCTTYPTRWWWIQRNQPKNRPLPFIPSLQDF